MTLVLQRNRVPRIAVLAAWLAGAGFLFSGAPSRADAEARLAVQATAQGLHITLPRDALAGGAILIVSSDSAQQTLEDNLRGFAADWLAIAMPLHQDTPFPVFLPRELFLDAVQDATSFQITLASSASARRGEANWQNARNAPRISPEDLPKGAWTALRQFLPAEDGAQEEAWIALGVPTTLVRLPVPHDQPQGGPITLISLRYTVTAQEQVRSVAFTLETPALASKAALFIWPDSHEWVEPRSLDLFPVLRPSAEAWASCPGPDRSLAATIEHDPLNGGFPATMFVFALSERADRMGYRRDAGGLRPTIPDRLAPVLADMILTDQWIQVAGGTGPPRLRANGVLSPPLLAPGAEFAEHYRYIELALSPLSIELLHHASLEP